MTKDVKAAARPGPKTPWPRSVRWLLLLALLVIVYLLAEDMVRHRFFRGGWVNQHKVLQP